MRMERLEEPLDVKIWDEMPEPEEIWKDIPDELKVLAPQEWQGRKEWIFNTWTLQNGMSVIASAFAHAVRQAEIDTQKLCVVSSVGCLTPIYELLKCDCFRVHQSRSIPFGIGLHLGNPSLKVVVLSDDSDILALGGNHLIHAARRNLDILVVCLHELSLDGHDEQPPFNLPYLLSVCGAPYIARWTILHWDNLHHTIAEALHKRGFRFVEVLMPTVFSEEPSEIVGALKEFVGRTELKHFASPEAEGDLLGGRIFIGKFVDADRLTFLDLFEREILSQFGS
ncbi:MAG: thiamine pyrophosphate-dependent enzyme [Candidatus Fervidibacter sp.]|uniref:thiamine pyrophosphate-dependent enzyme n=1 Tax=Candidatus Fervidibacter sp. TaxID=3100871 RepID=UPI00404A517F